MTQPNVKAAPDDRKLLSGVFGKYFVSSMFAILFSSAGQIGNSIVVGNTIGADKLAVMSLILPVYYVFATVGNLAGIGGSALCASLLGNREPAACKKAFTATYLLTLLLSAVFTVVFLCCLPGIVHLLGAEGVLYDDVMDYAVVMVVGGVFTAGIYLSFNFLRLDGRPVATILTFVIVAVVNIALDLLLTIPVRLGLTEISLATSLGAAAALFGVILIVARSELLGFTKLSLREFLSYTREIFRVGSPGATENASILLRSYLLNSLILSLVGAAALSSLSVVNSINSFALSIIAGGAGALVPLVGVLSSERDTVSIRRIVGGSLVICGIILAAFLAVTEVFAPEVARIFGISDPEQTRSTARAIRLFLLSLPPSLIGNLLIYLHLANNPPPFPMF